LLPSDQGGGDSRKKVAKRLQGLGYID
jgi:hypothetical protein